MNILVAEDDEPSRELMTDFLAGLGHKVRGVGDGAELVKLAMAERPDLIITDLQMPNMNGSSMIAMIDTYPGLEGIPVIIISGAADFEIADMGIPDGIKVLSKPYNFDLIKSTLAAVAEDIARRKAGE